MKRARFPLFSMLAVVVGAASLGCATAVMDLGGDSPKTKDQPPAYGNGLDNVDPNKLPNSTPIHGTEQACPAFEPTSGDACSRIDATFCPYAHRANPNVGNGPVTVTQCACGVEGRWICVDTFAGSFNSSSCTHGAPCDEVGSRCQLPASRDCVCLGSFRLHCGDGVAR